MKTLIVICSCMLFCSNAVMADLNGSDDFNDNVMDPAKWTVINPLLSETNNRLEFTTSGIGDENGTWAWIKNAGSYTQDWTVTVDAFNSSITSNQWSLVAPAVLGSNVSDGPLLIIGIASGGDEMGRGIIAGWQEGESDHYNWHSTTNYAAQLSLSYNALTKELSSAYNVGNGFITLTNRNISGLAMGTNDSFMIGLGGSTENSFIIESGEMYFDNFEAATLPGISNHLYEVEIDHGTEYREPESSSDDIYDFGIEILTDTTVSNIYVQCPGGASFTITDNDPDEGNLRWGYSPESSVPFFNQFGDGGYIVTITYSNGITQSAIIPFTQDDGTTPIPTVEDQPVFSIPTPFHNALFASPHPVTLTWANIDPDANAIEIERRIAPWGDTELIGLYMNFTVWEPTGPLSTRSIDSLLFSPANWIVTIGTSYEAWGTSSAGVEYSCAKGSEVDYHFTVLDPNEDYDGDGLPNGWEAEYFNGPTNAIATLDSDLDGHNNLQESITGMDPTNAASVFMITNSMPLADDFLIEWPSVEGRVYTAYWSTNLTNSFQSMGSDIDYPQNSYTDTLHGVEDECFYRVDVQLK